MEYAELFLKKYPETIDSGLKLFESDSLLYQAALRLKKGIDIKKCQTHNIAEIGNHACSGFKDGTSFVSVHVDPGALAPLAGYTDTTFRNLISKWGCGIYFTEMISAKGTCYNPEISLAIAEVMTPSNGHKPLVAVQLFGSEPNYMSQAGKAIEQAGLADVIDINMGCPVKKVVKTTSGSALMKEPNLAAECVAALNEAVTVPVTVKIRAGWDNSSKNACEVAEKCVRAGAGCVTIHPRTKTQMFSGTPDWDIAKKVRATLDPIIPVIANGNITSLDEAVNVMAATGCDNVMIGRGCLGNPWLFFEIKNLMRPGTVWEKLGKSGIGRLVYEHFEISYNKFGEKGIKMLRKHAMWYAAGLRNAKAFRGEIFKANTMDDVKSALSIVFDADFLDFNFKSN